MVDFSNVDYLASNGVINFDANAYLNGTTPRYVGNPDSGTTLPFDRPLPAYLHPVFASQPEADTFVKNEKEGEKEHKELTWKEALAIVLGGGLLVYGGIKINKWVKNAKAKKLAKEAEEAKKLAERTARVSKNTKTGKTTNPKNVFKNVKEWLKNLPKSVKIGGGAVAGLLALFGVYKLFLSKKNKNETVTEAPKISE